jgi:hypothetical protein
MSLALIVVTVLNVSASGPLGLFAVVEKVVFEPNEQAAERIQLWGAFAFVAGGVQGTFTAPPQRGYFYFSIPESYSQKQRETVRKEWADLKSVAGTSQGVAFGDFFYVGAFTEVNKGEVYAQQGSGRGIQGVKMHTDASSKPTPIPYLLNTGVVKLSATGSHAAAIEQLRALLKK